MKHLTRYLFLMTFLLSANAGLLEGCYKTISINFKKPTLGPINWRNQTTFEASHQSAKYKTIQGQNIELEALSLFQGFAKERQTYKYIPIVIFKNFGQKIENSFSYYYEVNDDFMIKEGADYKRVDHFLNLSILRFGKKIIGSYLFISKERDINEFHDFIIEKEACKN